MEWVASTRKKLSTGSEEPVDNFWSVYDDCDFVRPEHASLDVVGH
jgi:hypothetical protein